MAKALVRQDSLNWKADGLTQWDRQCSRHSEAKEKDFLR